MGRPVTSAEAAARLGVDVRTLYAYVSRGSLTRVGTDARRRSLYDGDEVEVLARHGRPRSTGRSRAGIDVVVGSAVSEIGDGWVRYRGVDAIGLATADTGFERVAALLWQCEPTGPEAWLLPGPARNAVARSLAGFPPDARAPHRMAAAVAVAAACADLFGEAVPVESAPGETAGRMLIATLIEAVSGRPGVADRDGGTVGTVAHRLWTRLSPLRPTPARLRALDRALVLLADHELATSTLAVRIATSTRAPLAFAVLSGLGTLSGPLHGGAADHVHRALDEAAATGNPAREPRGFGHPVHVTGDPRAAPLLDAVTPIADAATRALIGRTARAERSGVPPNLDFALGALCHAARMASGAAEVVFAVARCAGWVAHAREESAERPLRYRGRATPRSPAGPTPA